MAPDELQPRPAPRRPRRGGGGRQLLLGARGVDRAHLRRELVPAGPAERQAAYHRAGSRRRRARRRTVGRGASSSPAGKHSR